MKTTRSATSRAKRISWVTTIMVMPASASAHHRQHLADQLGIERRGRLVEQHQLGSHRERPGDRHALLLAARETMRKVVEHGPTAVPPQQPHARAAASARDLAIDLDRRLDDVLQRRQVVEQVEVLEHHADARLGARLRQVADRHAADRRRRLATRLLPST